MRRTRNRESIELKYNIDSDYCRSSEEENKDYVLVKMATLPKEIYKF